MNILAVESSCDETAVALVRDGRTVLSDAIASQVEMHTLYGGVVPEIASRKHLEAIYSLADQALSQAQLTRRDIDAVACTYAHDHHDLLVAGCTPADCAAAANWVIAHQGGYCAVLDGQVVASMELEVGGIVTERPIAELARDADGISKALADFGYRFPNPIMSFSVLGLTVSQALRITDRGYVDVRGGKLKGVFD
jgi:hypothetical protein